MSEKRLAAIAAFGSLSVLLLVLLMIKLISKMEHIFCCSSIIRWRRRCLFHRRFPTKANTSDGEWQEMEMDEVIDWDSGYATSMHTMGMWGCCVPTSEGLDRPAAIAPLRSVAVRRQPSDQSPLLTGTGRAYTLGTEFR